MPRIAERVSQLGTETALDVLIKARALEARGRTVIHLEVGEPDFPTPGHIVEAGVRALRDGHTRYGPPAGLPAPPPPPAPSSAKRSAPSCSRAAAFARGPSGSWSRPEPSRSSSTASWPRS